MNSNKGHNDQKQRYQMLIFPALEAILTEIQRKQFHHIANEAKDVFIDSLCLFKNSDQMVRHLRKVREALKKYLMQAKQPKQLLALMHFCLAIASQLTNSPLTENQYQRALSYDQNNSIIKIVFALFLYDKQFYQRGIQLITQLKVSNASEEQRNRKNIMYILRDKVEYSMNQQLLKPKSERQIPKMKFISQILKFKELFLYRCTQIHLLSQDSYSQLALMLLNSNRFEDSLTLTYKLRSFGQPTQNTRLILVTLFHALNKHEESIECAQQALRINPRNQSVYAILISSLIQLKRYLQAKNSTLRLLNINKHNYKAYQYLGRILLINGSRQLGVQFYRLAVVIQQSEYTYSILAAGLFYKGKLAQAERCYFKSIRIQPNGDNYCQLGTVYLSGNNYLNAIHCFIEAIKFNYTSLRPFYFLGICAKGNSNSRLIINRSIDQIKIENKQNKLFQTNLAVFYFISKQSQSPFFDFMSKFLQQRKKGEQTVYSDIATKLIQLYNLIGLNDKYLDVSFAAVMGYLGRVKEQYDQTRRIYAGLMNQYRANKSVSVCGAFIAIYQTYIGKTPKELQAFMLQFILAEMVSQSTEWAIKCYFKSLSYADGDYEQFHLQLFKKISKDIDELEPIDYIANSVFGKQRLSSEDAQTIDDTLFRNKFLDLRCYVCSLEMFAQIIRKLRQIQELDYPCQQSLKMINYFSSNYINRQFGLSWREKELKLQYTQIYKQIQVNQQGVKIKLGHLTKIYNEKNEYKQLLRAFTPILQGYFDEFAINQKVKMIFNHFYPYVLTQSCHKQFAFALNKLKNSPQYSSWELKEDLQNIFKEANKQKGKEWEPQRIGDTQSVASSVMSSVINCPLIDVISQTKSQMDDFDKHFQSFIFYEASQQRRQVGRKKSDSNIQSSGQDDYKEFMRQINEVESEKSVKIFKGSCGKKEQSLIYAQQYSEQQLSSQESENYFEISQKDEQESEMGQSQAAKWLQKQYFSHKTPFASGCRLYRKFQEILHYNTFSTIKYLSKNTTLKHIANHICCQSSINLSQAFAAKVEFGEQVNDEFFEGPTYALRWIIDIALGIAELQKLGIYHADLFFRNTIRVRRGNIFSFKIIDFDKAFKTKKIEKKDKGFECTRNMFDFWLRFKFEGRQRAPVYHLDIQSDSGVSTESSTLYGQRQIIEYIFMGAEQSLIQTLLDIKHQSIFSSEKMEKCLCLLQQHMVKSHLKQYSALVEKLLLGDSQQEIQARNEVINEEKITAIMEELKKLREKNVDYIQFAEKVEKIGGLAVQGQKEEQ